MKLVLQEKNFYLLRFDPGEEVINALKKFIKEDQVKSGHFTGLGACKETELGYYDLGTEAYIKKQISEDLEILGLTGNISWMNEEPVIHVHGSFGRKDMTVLGGHVFTLVVSLTCEVHLTVTKGSVERKKGKLGVNILL